MILDHVVFREQIILTVRLVRLYLQLDCSLLTPLAEYQEFLSSLAEARLLDTLERYINVRETKGRYISTVLNI